MFLTLAFNQSSENMVTKKLCLNVTLNLTVLIL